MIETVLFYFFAGAAVISALMLVMRKNPVTSAVSLIITFISFAGLYILLNAHFIAAIQILVYAGAIMVLFLFVIMLLDLKREEDFLSMLKAQKFFGIALAVIVLAEVFAAISSINGMLLTRGIYSAENIVGAGGNTKVIGRLLFTDFILPFEVTSILLLVAIIGAVYLGKKEN